MRRPSPVRALVPVLLITLGCVDLDRPADLTRCLAGCPDGSADGGEPADAPADTLDAPVGPPDAPADRVLDAIGDRPATESAAAPDVSDRDDAGPAPVGAVCTSGGQCASGFCVDGVCCDSACSGTCETCNLPGRAGTCGPDKAGTVCMPASCSGSTYTQARTCDGAGTCQPAQSASCAGYLCDPQTNACRTQCATAADCAAGVSCLNGSCGSAKPLGAACGGATECGSGFCEQGVCCATACSGDCRSCALAGSAGTCGLVPGGEDPLGQCADQGAASCGTDGACDGAGGCRKYGAGTVCVASVCSGGSAFTPARTCDGSGVCRPAAATQTCDPYGCDSYGCQRRCKVDAECAPTALCTGPFCRWRVGVACNADYECAAGNCEQGICCATACTANCRSCALAATLGTCAAVPVGQNGCGGLKAEYWENRDLTGAPKVTRIDPDVAFDWGRSAPDPAIPPDNFSGRWTGKITPRTSEAYTFYTVSDDGVRLWIDNVLVIDNWTVHSPTENASAPLPSVAGQPRDIRLEHFEGVGDATIRLLWSTPTSAKQIVPSGALSPAP